MLPLLRVQVLMWPLPLLRAQVFMWPLPLLRAQVLMWPQYHFRHHHRQPENLPLHKQPMQKF